MTQPIPTSSTLERDPFPPHSGPRLGRHTSAEAIARSVRQNGFAIVEKAFEHFVDPINEQLAPYLDACPPGEASFMGTRTRRTSRLVWKSPACREVILDPTLQQTLTLLFAGECYHQISRFA